MCVCVFVYSINSLISDKKLDMVTVSTMPRCDVPSLGLRVQVAAYAGSRWLWRGERNDLRGGAVGWSSLATLPQPHLFLWEARDAH